MDKEIFTLSEENRRISRVDTEYDENMAGATDELNRNFRPELQDKIDAEQNKLTNDNDVVVEFDKEGKPTIKSLKSGIMAGNVNITWEADQKCIKPKVTVNELATHEEIATAVNNAKTAFYMSCQLISESGDIAAPMPLPEPKEQKPKYTKKDLKDLDE